MGVHADLIQELPEKVLEGNTVVSQLSSVKSHRHTHTHTHTHTLSLSLCLSLDCTKLEGSTTAAKRKFRIIIIPVSEGPLWL